MLVRVWLLLVCYSWVFAVQAQTIRIDSVVIQGNVKTKEAVILRQMAVVAGDTFQIGDLEAIKATCRENIYNLGLFTRVELDTEWGPNGLLIWVRLQERWFVLPQPYLALEERTFNEWWADKDLDRLVYGLGVNWQNVSGWNDNLFVYAQNGYSRRLTVEFTRPFLFPKPQIDGTFSFYYTNNKEIGFGTRGGILQLARLGTGRIRESFIGEAMFGKRFSARKQLQFTLGFKSFHVHDSLLLLDTLQPNLSQFYLTDGAIREQYPFYGLNFVNDQRDMKAFPLSGYKFNLFCGGFGLPGWGSSFFGKAGFGFSHHVPVSRRWNFAYGHQSFFLLGKKVPYYDKFFIGFEHFLRGFEPYVVDGSWVALTKAEWKYAIIPRKFVHLKRVPFKRFQDMPLGFYLSLFSDAGHVRDHTFNNLDPFLKNRLLLGYGMGLNFFTIYDSLVRVEYSRNNLSGWGVYLSALVSIQ